MFLNLTPSNPLAFNAEIAKSSQGQHLNESSILLGIFEVIPTSWGSFDAPEGRTTSKSTIKEIFLQSFS